MLLILVFIKLHSKKYCKCKDNTRRNTNNPNRFIVELEIIIHFPIDQNSVNELFY